VALCATRLATLHLTAGHTAEGATAVHAALRAVPGLRSVRIAEDLATMQAATQRHPSMTALSDEITRARSATA
jgi:hypothetical protein